jgi:hypothetical protein
MSNPLYTIIDDGAFSTATSLNIEVKTPVKSNIKNRSGNIVDVRNAIAELFDGFIMTKTQQFQTFGIYKASVESQSGNEQKYIVAIIPNDQQYIIGSNFYLKDLNWVNFQSRSTDDTLNEFANYNLKPQQYSIKKDNILFDKIKLGGELETKHIYIPDNLPITVELILKKSDQTFAQEGTVISAIQLFQTVISLDGN